MWKALLALLATGAWAQVPLPKGAQIIERVAIPSAIHGDREIVLWMLSPVKHERNPREGPYTCPDVTRGSYYAGPTRVSLVDSAAQRILNTVRLIPDEQDSFEIPYRILPGYYLVPGGSTGVEGKPALLALRDFNGDGLALEFAFYRAEACMGLDTALFGYSVKQDQVIQYVVDLNGERATWVDHLFVEKPNRLGLWRFQIDYRGRAGTLDSYTVRYDRNQEKFVGTIRRTP